jgi:hypothetical protein
VNKASRTLGARIETKYIGRCGYGWSGPAAQACIIISIYVDVLYGAIQVSFDTNQEFAGSDVVEASSVALNKTMRLRDFCGTCCASLCFVVPIATGATRISVLKSSS